MMNKITEEDINKLTHKIIGCAMEVHNQMGNGFTHFVNMFFNGIRDCFAIQEVVYQRALSIELNLNNISHQRELEMPLEYKGYNVGTRRVDFFVEDKVMVEIKAIEKLEGVHKAQAINYCEAYNITDGLLINFGAERLQYHRVFNKNLKNKTS